MANDAVERSEKELDSYAAIMNRAARSIRLKANEIRQRSYGGMINMISAPEDLQEQNHLLEKLFEELGIKQTDAVHIDVGSVVSTLELGLRTYQLGIPEDHLNIQNLSENVSEYIYRFFGKEGQGLRMGMGAMIDSLKRAAERSNTSLKGTPFEDFLATLNLDLGENKKVPKIFVLHYPPLDTDAPIEKPENAEFRNLDPQHVQNVEKFLSVFSYINLPYPSRFQSDNPAGHVVINIVDQSYVWFATRNSSMIANNAYEYLSAPATIVTPSSEFRDKRIASKL